MQSYTAFPSNLCCNFCLMSLKKSIATVRNLLNKKWMNSNRNSLRNNSHESKWIWQVNILFYFKLNQWYQKIVRGNRTKHPPSKTEVLIYSTKRRKTDGEDSTNESIVTLQIFNAHRNRHKRSMYLFRRVSYHIQHTYNSTHKINLFSL